MSKLLIITVLLSCISTSSFAQDSEDILVDWKLKVYSLVMKYEKPRCIKFFWLPGGCPESQEALDFKAKCEQNPELAGQDYTIEKVSNLLPKIAWYQNHLKYNYYNFSQLKSNADGLVDITKVLSNFLGAEGVYDVSSDKLKLKSGEKAIYYTEHDGKKLWLNMKTGGEDSELFVTENLKSLVIRRPVCPKNSNLLSVSSIPLGSEFAYMMTVITPAR